MRDAIGGGAALQRYTAGAQFNLDRNDGLRLQLERGLTPDTHLSALRLYYQRYF